MDDLSAPLRTMKRIIILLLALMPIVASAQKVTKNEIDEMGVRHIVTDMRVMYVGQSPHGCQLSYKVEDGIGAYIFSLALTDQSSKWTSHNGQKLLMKAEDGTVFEIISKGASKSVIGRGTRGATYQTVTLYTISEEQAEVFAKGLIKLRIGLTYDKSGETGLMDIDVPSDMTNYLKKAHRNISKTIPLPADVDKSAF